MSGINPTAALTYFAFALAYALRGGRGPEAAALAAIPVAALPLLRPFRLDWPSTAPNFVPVLALLAWGFFTAAFGSPAYLHFDRLALIATYLMVAVSTSTWDEKEKRGFALLVLFVGVVESITFLLAHMTSGAVTGYLAGNPTYSALAVAAGLLAVPTFAEKRRASVLVPAAILMVAALCLLRSRSALIGFIAGMAFVSPRRRYLVGLGVLGAALGALALIDVETLLSYFKVFASQPHHVTGRLAIWKAAVAAVTQKPIFGWGFGNFEAAYLRNQLPLETALRFDRSTPFAHNDFLQAAVEGGLPALALLVWALWRYSRSARAEGATPTMRWSRAVIALFGTAAIVNFTFQLPVNGYVAAAAFGMAFSPRIKTEGGRRLWKSPLWAVVPAAVVVFAVLDGVSERLRTEGRPEAGARLFPIRSDLWYEAGLRAAAPRQGRDAGAALAFFRKAVRWNDDDAFAWNRLAVTAMSASKTDVDVPAALARAIELAPNHAPFWLDAGFERLRVGDAESAHAFFSEASRLEPNAPLPWFALAAVAKEKGNMDDARALLEKAVDLGNRYGPAIEDSGYASYLFGMSEEQMRGAILGEGRRRSPKRD